MGPPPMGPPPTGPSGLRGRFNDFENLLKDFKVMIFETTIFGSTPKMRYVLVMTNLQNNVAPRLKNQN